MKQPVKYKLGRNSSKISFVNWASEFNLERDIADFCPPSSHSRWLRQHWLCSVSLARLHIPEPQSAAHLGRGHVQCSGFGNVFLDRFKLPSAQMNSCCFVSLPGLRGSQLEPPPHGSHSPEGDASSASSPLLACICCFPDSGPGLPQRFHTVALMTPERESLQPASLEVQPKAINQP